jgi:hypothetical protein
LYHFSRAAAIIRAHSMRFLWSLHPKSYTLLMSPFEWKLFAAQPPAQYSLAQQLPHLSRV